MDYHKLLAVAAAKSSKLAAETHRKEQERLAGEKAAEEARRRRELADRQAAADRRREREERDRKVREEDERKKKKLPKTRNAYGMMQERIKRGMDLNGKDDVVPTKAKVDKTPRPVKDGGPPTREQKLARQRAALFKEDDSDGESGGMALHRAFARTGATSSQPKPHSASPKPLSAPVLIPARKPVPPSALSSSRKLAPPPTSSLSARDRLKASFKPNAFIKLNENKRDLRTIEEVERDMKRLKEQTNGSGNASPAPPRSSSQSASTRPSNASASTSRKSATASKSLPPPSPAKRSDIASLSSKGKSTSAVSLVPPRKSTAPTPGRKRDQRDESESSSDESDESYERRRKRKRSKAKGEDRGLSDSARLEIWKLMGRDRQKDLGAREYDSEDSDMEATQADVWREERKAERAGRQEEALEEERLRKHAEEKKRRLSAKTGGK